jgi:DNA-binding PadR family transcriptional regulator
MNSQDAILGMLMKHSLSGYEIKQIFEQRFSYFFQASYGTIYPMLGKMEREGLITKENVIQEGRPNKHLYTITDKGKQQFFAYLNSPLKDDTFKSDFLMRLYFGEFVDEENIINWINSEIKHTRELVENLKRDYEGFFSYLSPSQKLCIEFGISAYRSKLETLEKGITQFTKIEP